MKLDPTIAFFLKHEQQINEWVALKEKARHEAHEFFKSLAPNVVALASTLQARAHLDLEGPFRKLFLIRDPWLGVAGKPRAAIGLEWQASKASFREAWTGIWVDEKQKGGRELRTVLEAESRAMRVTGNWKKPQNWWPLWRYEPPEGDAFLDDL